MRLAKIAVSGPRLLLRYRARPSIRGVAAVAVAVAVFAAACDLGDEVPALERRAQQLNTAIMCPVCPGESIDQSQNPLALQMRSVVVEKLGQGWTEGEIKDFFVERYGPSVLLEPETEGLTLAVWVIPPVAVLGAALALFLTLRVMRRRPGEVGRVERPGVPSNSDVAYYYRRIQEAVGSGESEAR